jgi:hypothetical protein
LQDTLNLLPTYVSTPVVRQSVLDQYPKLATVLEPVSEALDNDTITALIARVDLGADGEAVTGDEEEIGAVAQAFLCEKTLIEACESALMTTPVATSTATIPLPVTAALPTEVEVTVTIEVVTPDTYAVNARATADIAATVVAVLPRSTAVLAIGRTADNDWLQIQLPDNQVVWVFTAAVLVNPEMIAILPVVTPPGL